MKLQRILVFIALILLFVPVINAVPPWKRQPTEPTQTEPTREIIIINQTVPVQEEGANWEMIGVIIAVLAVSASIAGWFLTRKKSSTTSKYLGEINNLYSEYRTSPDKCEINLRELKRKIEMDFSSGKITEQSFDILDRKIDNYLGEIRKGVVGKFDLTGDVKKQVDKALKDGRITKDEYESIKKMDLKDLVKDKKEKLLKLLEGWREKK